MLKKHSCEKLIDYLQGDEHLKILFEYSPAVQEWKMTFEQYADQKEVDMGEADFEGELSLSVEMTVHFCPYCGIKFEE